MADNDMPYIVIERRSGGFGAFLLGALVGAGIALLYAPRSGQETRDELRQGARRLRDSAEDTVRQVQDSVTGTVDDVRREVNHRIGAARDAFEAGRSAARETRADLERRLNDTREVYRSSRTGTRPASAAPEAAPGAGDMASEGDLEL